MLQGRQLRRRYLQVKTLAETGALVTGLYYMTQVDPRRNKERIHLFFVVAPRPSIRHPMRGPETN